MLRSNAVERKIKKIAIAENVKLEGISSTSRRLLDGGRNSSICDIVAEFYRDEEQTLFNKIGFTIILPYTIALSALVKAGAMGVAMLAKLQEKETIEQLVQSGVIQPGQEQHFIAKIEALNEDNDKIFAFTADDIVNEVGGISR